MIKNRFQLIFSNSEFNRILIHENPENGLQIRVDVHGMKCSQARRFINNIINTVRCNFRLTIIHGFHHGTAIKEMLANDFSNHHVTNHFADPQNLGITYLFITT